MCTSFCNCFYVKLASKVGNNILYNDANIISIDTPVIVSIVLTKIIRNI